MYQHYKSSIAKLKPIKFTCSTVVRLSRSSHKTKDRFKKFSTFFR